MKINYVGNQGDFTMENPEMLSYLYFPIANESGVMSSVAPDLAGDSKMSQNSFLMPPVSCENLHNDKSSRNVWCKINGKTLWAFRCPAGRAFYRGQGTNLFGGRLHASQDHTYI